MLDNEKWIGAQAIMKELIGVWRKADTLDPEAWLKDNFTFCMKIMEDYATLPEGEEFINTGIEIPKQFWNLPNQTAKDDFLTEWGRTRKVEGKGWYVFCKGKDLPKLKSVFDGRVTDFDEMVKAREAK